MPDIEDLTPIMSRPGEILGVIGAMIYILGFFLAQLGWICGNSIRFALSKVIGATLVLSSLYTSFNLSAALIQISFLIIGLYGISKRLRAQSTFRPRNNTKRH